ncbi:MAG: stage 0 sporulation family protein [Clostridia bacterium]|nr:stage 0 sporulation family protein [Clostridia bacterium]
MAEVIGVRFNGGGKIYYFDPDNTVFTKGEKVIVETSRGVECAEVAMENKVIDDDQIVKPLKKIIRSATEGDIRKIAENKKKEQEAFEICQQKIAAHKLDMKLTNVEYAFDDSKILFYFTADGRVDFRELVKDLAAAFRNRIELRQIGVRDEAKMLGGVGICGQPLCCSRFLDEFQPVSIKMAKEQNLSPNPLKISGSCGRLMCCLKYEHDTYEQLIRETPGVGSVVNTSEGRGVVVEANILTGNLKVRFDKYPDALPKTFNLRDVEVISKAGYGANKRKAQDTAAAKETEEN